MHAAVQMLSTLVNILSERLPLLESLLTQESEKLEFTCILSTDVEKKVIMMIKCSPPPEDCDIRYSIPESETNSLHDIINWMIEMCLDFQITS